MNTKQQPAPVVWWIIWGTITAAFFMAVGIFEIAGVLPETPPWMALIALGPFTISAGIRFLALPRASEPRMRFTLFILGLALAESGGFIGLIFVSAWKTSLAAAAIVLMTLYIPAFIRRE